MISDTLQTPQGPVSVDRYAPTLDEGVRLVLSHGAGGTLRTPALVRYAEACARHGIETLCVNMPYAEQGRRRPDRTAVVEAAWRAIISQTREGCGRLLAGGRSYGGRMASHAVAAGEACDGLVFLSYPLHPPGQPDKLRDAHLQDIHVPMLFLQGDRDVFATLDLLRATVASLPTARLELLEGADHGLAIRGRSAAEVTEELATRTVSWLSETAPAANP